MRQKALELPAAPLKCTHLTLSGSSVLACSCRCMTMLPYLPLQAGFLFRLQLKGLAAV